MLTPKDRRKIEEWDAFYKDIQRQSAVDSGQPYAERQARLRELEADPPAWMREMFPQYCRCDFADFQIMQRIRALLKTALSRHTTQTKRSVLFDDSRPNVLLNIVPHLHCLLQLGDTQIFQ